MVRIFVPGTRIEQLVNDHDDRQAVKLEINGSNQTVRMCAERAGLPPLLVVQAGPGLPVRHEVKKFQRHLQLERDFLVSYWDQRGCGNASQQDANSVSLPQQVDDLRAILAWFHTEAKQPIIVFGISLGATIVLRAVEREPGRVKSVIAISPDANTAASDASVYAFLQEQSVRAGSSPIERPGDEAREAALYRCRRVPQRRASLLGDLGSIEHGKTFMAILRETLVGMIRTSPRSRRHRQGAAQRGS